MTSSGYTHKTNESLVGYTSLTQNVVLHSVSHGAWILKRRQSKAQKEDKVQSDSASGRSGVESYSDPSEQPSSHKKLCQ